jgi:hypothetical protein
MTGGRWTRLPSGTWFSHLKDQTSGPFRLVPAKAAHPSHPWPENFVISNLEFSL